jgi:hypothetical protein
LALYGCQTADESEMSLVYYVQPFVNEENSTEATETSATSEIADFDLPVDYPYDAGFTGIVAQEAQHEYGNTPFANLDQQYMNRNICYVPENQSLYYVDFDFLYQTEQYVMMTIGFIPQIIRLKDISYRAMI